MKKLINITFVNKYDYSIDYALARSLHIHNTLTYNKLKETIESREYLNRKLSGETFHDHINKMLKGEYICMKNIESWKLGKKKFFLLHHYTEEQIQLNTLLIRYEEHDKIEQESMLQSYPKLKKRERTREEGLRLELTRRKIYYVIMRVVAIQTPNRSYKYQGVSMTDILNARYDGHAFYYLRLEDYRPLVEECITNLLKLNVIKQIGGIPTDEEPRYEFVETICNKFVNDVSGSLEHDITLMLNMVWQNLRPPTPQDRLYFEWCWGDRYADEKLKKVYSNLQVNKKENLTQGMNKKDKEDLIRSLKYNIVDLMKDLRETYAELIKEHPFTWETIIGAVYPEYLRKEIEKIALTSKYKMKKYPKHRRIFSKDTLVLI